MKIIPDWFVPPKMLEDLESGEDFDNNESLEASKSWFYDKIVEWCSGYKQRKTSKKQKEREVKTIALQTS